MNRQRDESNGNSNTADTADRHRRNSTGATTSGRMILARIRFASKSRTDYITLTIISSETIAADTVSRPSRVSDRTRQQVSAVSRDNCTTRAYLIVQYDISDNINNSAYTQRSEHNSIA